MTKRLKAREVTELKKALYYGSTKKVRKLLDQGWHPATPLSGVNPLAFVHSIPLARLLIDAGADLNSGFQWMPPVVIRSSNGPEATLEFLLASGADVNASYQANTVPDLPRGTTALMKAIDRGKVDTAMRLLEAGADPNLKDEYGHNALWYAAFGNRSEMIKELVKRGAAFPEDVLAGPVYQGNIEIVKLLIKKGANVNPQNIRRWHKRFDNFETLLGMSIRKIGFFDYPETIAPLLIRAGADVNQRWFNRPPINLAALMGLTKIVRELIKAGADVDAEDTSGNTALGEVAITGRVDLVKLLIAAGANVNHQGREYKTPLEWAWKYGHPEIVKLLEIAGSQVKGDDVAGNTALEETIMKGHKLSVEAVIRAGANVNHRGPTGKTPLELAKQCGQEEIVQLLKKFGAKV